MTATANINVTQLSISTILNANEEIANTHKTKI